MLKIYRKLFPYLRPHLPEGIAAAFCMIASTILDGFSLGMLVPLIDVILLNRVIHLPAWAPAVIVEWVHAFEGLSPPAKLHAVVGFALFFFFLKNLALFGQTYLMSDLAMRFLRDVRNGLYRHYQKLSVDFFSGERTGDLVSRITYDVAVLHNSITQGVADLIFQSAKVVMFTAIVVAIDWRLAAVVLFLILAIGLMTVRIGRILRKLGLEVQQRMADLNSRLIETLQGVRIIKAFTAEEAEARRFADINQGYYKATMRTVKRQEVLAGLTDLIGMGAGLFVLVVGGHAVLGGTLSLGTFVLFLGALLSLVQPVKKLSRLHSVNQQALIAARRVVELLDTEPSVVEAADAMELPRFRREIRFQDIWFKYQDRFVLQGVNLTVRAGEVIGIVGSSGTGKTTLVNLIPRFYDPVREQVTVDGVDLKKVSLISLRSQIGLVNQDPFLFHDTVRVNIAFGRPNAPLEEVIRAAKAANADDFIRRLPAGYDTPVGELGTRLSGGERQRIAIARALLKDPPILILDEATSQLDSESEALVQEALERLMKGRTPFVISHRLSTIRNVDRIIVLDQGKVAEMGRHEELLQASPLYRRLYELQIAQ